MDKKNKRHDLLIERINDIFITLYQGSEISKNWLCQRFHVTERTAYRDLARLASILDEVSPGKYRLSKELMPRLPANELGQFASFADVAHLFPSSSSRSIRDFMTSKQDVIVRGHTSRDNRFFYNILNTLRQAISTQSKLGYSYKGKSRVVEPYKLINNGGLWYLAAVENNKLKSFEIGLIEEVNVSDQQFNREIKFLEELENNKGIYFGNKVIVTLKVSSKAANYISRRELFPEQRLLKKEDDGELIISVSITESEVLFRWLRYWMPEISILTPTSLAHQFSDDLLEKVSMGLLNVQL